MERGDYYVEIFTTCAFSRSYSGEGGDRAGIYVMTFIVIMRQNGAGEGS